jgi:hypothetical protein
MRGEFAPENVAWDMGGIRPIRMSDQHYRPTATLGRRHP